jgi:hypothetical protein
MSPREIVETVREEGFSEKVAEKFKKMLIQRMPLHTDKFKPKGMTVGDMTLQALRNAKQAEAEVSNMARGGGHTRGKKSASDSRKKDELRDSSLQRSGTSESGGGLSGGNNKLKAINRRKSTIHGGVADMTSMQPGKEGSRRTSSHDATTPSKLHSESYVSPSAAFELNRMPPFLLSLSLSLSLCPCLCLSLSLCPCPCLCLSLSLSFSLSPSVPQH